MSPASPPAFQSAAEVHASPDHITRALDLLAADTAANDRSPLDDHQLADFAQPATDSGVLLAADGQGFCYLNRLGPRWQLGVVATIDPFTALTAAAAWVAGHGGGALLCWSAQTNTVWREALSARAFRPARSLRRLSHALPHPAELDPRLEVRAFAPTDTERFLAFNRLAFAADPDQGLWRAADLHARQRAPWFSTANFLVADTCLGGGRPPDALAGCCWTKVHTTRHIGEIYVIAAHPQCQGTGMGRALAVAGMAHLADQHLKRVELYVDAANTAGLHLYNGLGFGQDIELVCYVQDASR